jgi:hypothetical protein
MLCKETRSARPLGVFKARQELIFLFTVHQTDGVTVVYRSDDSESVTVSPVSGGWRVTLEDGGGPPEDIVLDVRILGTWEPPTRDGK